MKKIISLVTAILMVFQLGAFAVADFNAPALSENEWSNRYNSLKDDNTLPMLCVGSDETQVSLCWHADKETAVAQVKLAKNAAMDGATIFDGEKTDAETEEQGDHDDLQHIGGAEGFPHVAGEHANQSVHEIGGSSLIPGSTFLKCFESFHV